MKPLCAFVLFASFAAMVPSARAEAPAPEAFAFVLHHRAPYVVLTTLAEAEWGAGAVVKISKEAPVTLEQAVREGALPEALRGWKGRAVALYDEKGLSCRGRIAEVVLLHRIALGLDLPEDKEPKELLASASPYAVQRMIAAKVTTESGECRGALWARDAARPAPVFHAAATEPSPALRQRAIARLRGLEAYAGIQKSFRSEVAKARGRWDSYDGARVDVRRFAGEGREYVLASATAGEGCGGFFGALWALWEVKGGKLVLQSADAPTQGGLLPVAAVGGDGGAPMLIGHETLYRKVGNSYIDVLSVAVPFQGCGC